MKLIAMLPDTVKSPKLTADWENALGLVARGELERKAFMDGIEVMVSDLVKKHSFMGPKILGCCPNCGRQVVTGKFGAYCVNKCGMNVGWLMGMPLDDEQVKTLLAGEKILLKGLTSKKGTPYDAYIIPDGIEEYRFTHAGKEGTAMRFKFHMEFPEKKGK